MREQHVITAHSHLFYCLFIIVTDKGFVYDGCEGLFADTMIITTLCTQIYFLDQSLLKLVKQCKFGTLSISVSCEILNINFNLVRFKSTMSKSSKVFSGVLFVIEHKIQHVSLFSDTTP